MLTLTLLAATTRTRSSSGTTPRSRPCSSATCVEPSGGFGLEIGMGTESLSTTQSHKEQFEIGYSDWSNQTAETALGISFVGGAMTPTSGNPGTRKTSSPDAPEGLKRLLVRAVFRVYDVDPDSFEVMDHKSYIANYSAPSFQVEPEWFLYYSAREAYGPLVGLQDGEALDARFWHKVTEVFETNS